MYFFNFRPAHEKAGSEKCCMLLKKVQTLKGNMDSIWKELAQLKIIPSAVLHPNPRTGSDETIVVFKNVEGNFIFVFVDL